MQSPNLPFATPPRRLDLRGQTGETGCGMDGCSYVVATEMETCQAVAEQLGFYPDTAGNEGYTTGVSGMVVRLEDYNGFAAKAIWERS